MAAWAEASAADAAADIPFKTQALFTKGRLSCIMFTINNAEVYHAEDTDSR